MILQMSLAVNAIVKVEVVWFWLKWFSKRGC
jgi:hypothetical protein